MINNKCCDDTKCIYQNDNSKNILYDDLFCYFILAFKQFYFNEYVTLKNNIDDI
jgi:hypothetical protein